MERRSGFIQSFCCILTLAVGILSDSAAELRGLVFYSRPNVGCAFLNVSNIAGCHSFIVGVGFMTHSCLLIVKIDDRVRVANLATVDSSASASQQPMRLGSGFAQAVVKTGGGQKGQATDSTDTRRASCGPRNLRVIL
jgi:hypothetical protein